MSEQRFGVTFSCNADQSRHDYAMHVNSIDSHTVAIGARYRGADYSSIYEIRMDTEDLRKFGRMCQDLAALMEEAQEIS